MTATDVVRSYTQQLRWGRLEGASLFIDSKKRAEWLGPDEPRLEGLRSPICRSCGSSEAVEWAMKRWLTYASSGTDRTP